MRTEAWQQLVKEMAALDKPQVIEEARAGARVRARAILEDALVEELLSAFAHPEKEQAEAEAEAGDAWWAYCVLPAERAAELALDLTGIEPGSSVEAVVEGELAALVSRVPLSEYGDDRLREHLEDIGWLEQTARRHEEVQEAILRQQAIVPLRLCTLYRDLEKLRRVLRANAEVFAQNLVAVDGCSEWGVKVFLGASTAPDPDAGEPAGSGLGYLAGRQRERDRAAQVDQLCARCTEEVHQELAALCRQERLNPVQHPEAHGRDAEMVLNGAYLVEGDRFFEFQSAVMTLQERWSPHGLDVELTGPWPPYNFVSESAEMIS